MKISPPLAPLRDVRTRLARQFLAHAEALPAYRQRVLRECRAFPEGDLLPFVFPALGLLTLARAGRLDAPRAHAAAAGLLEESRHTFERRFGPVTEFRAGRHQAVYTGWLALGLCAFRHATGDLRFDEARRRLCDALLADVEARSGQPLDSFPGAVWPFDTIPPLVALQMSDRLDGHQRSAAAIRRHLDWIRDHGTHSPSGLPLSRVDHPAGGPGEQPRGCDLSLRVGLMRLLDPVAARELYSAYAATHWCEMGALAGFREYARGASGEADADSGALVAGLGMAASGFGVGAAAIMRDRWRTWRLCSQFRVVSALAWCVAKLSSASPLRRRLGEYRDLTDPRCATGFLFGDVCLFLTLTWPLASAEVIASAGPPAAS